MVYVKVIVVALKEKKDGENRVSITPDMAKKIKEMGLVVRIEKGAGEAAGFSDDQYQNVGSEIIAKDITKDANVVFCVNLPEEKELNTLKKGTYLIGQLKPFETLKSIQKLAKQGVFCLSMELLPRITRAQSMDILSSQANLAGYRSVIDASFEFKRAFPLMMTAAGTIAAAKVLVLGVGVAGLQAIATAKRLGSIVSAYDVRPETAEQVKSLGATFIKVDFEESGKGDGGYAKEMSESYKMAQGNRLKEVIKSQDIVITTAQIPGKKAPLLVTEEMVSLMKRGSVIVDLAVESGGNCALSKFGQTVDVNGVKILGAKNILSSIAYDASQLYAKNLFTFFKTLFKQNENDFIPDMEDELMQGVLLSAHGAICHPRFKDIIEKDDAEDQPIDDHKEKKIPKIKPTKK